MNLDDAAREAVRRHDRLLAMKSLELALGKLVELDGVVSVRRVLLRYCVMLKWF